MTCDASHHVGGFVGKMPWTCPSCGRTHCALCSGADDERGDLCDECWAMEEELARPDAMFRRSIFGFLRPNYANIARQLLMVEPIPEMPLRFYSLPDAMDGSPPEIPPTDCRVGSEALLVTTPAEDGMSSDCCDVCDEVESD